MSDARLRALEKLAAQGDPHEVANFLRGRMRLGLLEERRVEQAAYLGDEASQIALAWSRGPDDASPIHVFSEDPCIHCYPADLVCSYCAEDREWIGGLAVVGATNEEIVCPVCNGQDTGPGHTICNDTGKIPRSIPDQDFLVRCTVAAARRALPVWEERPEEAGQECIGCEGTGRRPCVTCDAGNDSLDYSDEWDCQGDLAACNAVRHDACGGTGIVNSGGAILESSGSPLDLRRGGVDNRPRRAIEAVETWLNCPCEEHWWKVHQLVYTGLPLWAVTSCQLVLRDDNAMTAVRGIEAAIQLISPEAARSTICACVVPWLLRGIPGSTGC